MIQCKECEYYRGERDGTSQFTCDPFSTIKEPECLAKWQLIQLQVIAESHRATLEMYRRLAPLQEKMFRHMEREIEEVDEADRWKSGDDEEEGEEEDEDNVLRL